MKGKISRDRVTYHYVHKIYKNVTVSIMPLKDGKGFYDLSDEAWRIADELLKECIKNSDDFIYIIAG